MATIVVASSDDPFAVKNGDRVVIDLDAGDVGPVTIIAAQSNVRNF